MKKTLRLLILILVGAIMVTACTSTRGDGDREGLEEDLRGKEEELAGLRNELDLREAKINELENKIESLETDSGSPSENILVKSMELMELLAQEDMEGLSQHVHPSKGLRFTPYPYIDVEEDLVFTGAEVGTLMEDEETRHWGQYDGSGEDIDLKFSEYYNIFVYSQDFLNPHIIGNSTAIGQGNTINNIEEAYPNSPFVEFHFTGIDPQYAGIDWESLTLVFEEVNGEYYLVAIVHGQWTI